MIDERNLFSGDSYEPVCFERTNRIEALGQKGIHYFGGCEK